MSGVPAAGDWQPVGGSTLPIYRHDVGVGDETYTAFYAPGCLCVVPREATAPFAAALRTGKGGDRWAIELGHRAATAQIETRRQVEAPFEPECLTLYLNNACNLRCVYCYADPAPVLSSLGRAGASGLDLTLVAAAAHRVAANCRDQDLPFYVVLHGGGEPLLDPAQAEEVLTLLDEVARAHRVEPYYYVATNGVLDDSTAAWLARRFHRVGLSCDGPAGVHDRQRPGPGGRPTLAAVERTASMLREARTHFHVRATITRHSLNCQAEVADYICRRLRPAEISFEPVYAGARSRAGHLLVPADVPAFVEGLLAARHVAWEHGVRLATSGSRLAAIHGPYCHVFRQVLNLVPGGTATACFKAATEADVRARGLAISGAGGRDGTFHLDLERVAALRRRLSAVPARCRTCFNRYHCAGDCPDRCRLDGDDGGPGGFRCQMLRTLSARLLAEEAATLWRAVASGAAEAPHGTRLC